MSIRERLLEIPELIIAQRLQYMGNVNLEEYIASLGVFIEKFPTYESEIKSLLEAKDYKALSICLADVREMLICIYADKLAEECLIQMNRLTNVKHEKLEAFIIYFLSMLAVLSIDIQMALYKVDESVEEIIDNMNKDEKPEEEPKDEGNIILAVDDSPFFLDMLKNALTDSSYKLTCVTSGAAALKYLAKTTPDLFIFDIEMPRMNGYELIKEVRNLGHSAPVILLTGNATRDYVLKAIESGAADFIVKPINQTLVLERISKFLKPQ